MELEDRVAERTAQLEAAGTENKQLRERAENRAAELQSVLDNMADGVFVVNAEGRVTMVNDAGLRIIGLESVEATSESQGFQERSQTRADDRQISLPSDFPLARALAGETVVNDDAVFRNPRTGRSVYIRTNATPIRSQNGRIAGAVAVARDVTELMELDHLKDQFITVAAHELKTPVAIMKGFSQLLLRDTEDLSNRRRKLLAAIDRGANRIDAIVRDLLDISLLTTGQVHLAPERIDLTEFVEQSVARVAATSPGHRLWLPRTDAVSVLADRVRLAEIMDNVLDNAIRYSPAGGTIEVEVRDDGEHAVVSVTDHGVGIPGGKQSRIFQRFYRAHNGTPYDYGGMGVGLYISREVVRRLGGEMGFESVEGVGTTFHFSLPTGEKNATC
jgi:two-component system, OmpR family, sensor histidine kinase VicK